jgi:phosphohistidine phosphatase
MNIYLMRHGEAESLFGATSDESRRLTPEGRDEVRGVAARLADANVKPDVIYASPLDRALETARIVADVLGVPDRVQISEAVAGCSPGDLQGIIGPSTADVMLVGHNPDMELLTRWLTGAICDFKKAAVARITTDRVEPEAGTLRWLVTPRVLGA